MLAEIEFELDDFASASKKLKEVWADKNLKVFVLKAKSVPQDVKTYYESIFPLLGKPEPLAEDVGLGDRDSQRSGKIWFEVRYVPNSENAYRHSANAQPLHTDGSYIPSFPSSTLLACVANAGEGGETTFIDSRVLHRIMSNENPTLLEKLMSNKMPHERSGDFRNDEVIRLENDDVFVNWNYYCVSKDISDELKKTAEEFHQYLLNSEEVKKNTIGVKLQPGDGVFWRDNYVLHGRNSFKANMESERFIWKCAIDILPQLSA